MASLAIPFNLGDLGMTGSLGATEAVVSLDL